MADFAQIAKVVGTQEVARRIRQGMGLYIARTGEEMDWPILAEEVAKKLNRKFIPSTVTRWKQGKQRLTLIELLATGYVLGIRPAWLAFEDGAPEALTPDRLAAIAPRDAAGTSLSEYERRLNEEARDREDAERARISGRRKGGDGGEVA